MKNEVTGHWKKLVSDPKYLGEADFASGQEVTVTIAAVTKESVKNADGSAEKIVIHFVENCKPMILNVTNSKAIAKVTGEKLVEKWKGARIQLYIDPKVRAFGEVVAALRVRPFAPRQNSQPVQGKPIPCEKCGNNIKPFDKMTTEQLAEYTKSKYGKALCSDCAAEMAKEAKSGQEEVNENN
ncbi:hypothetical protein [Anaerotignum sp. MB30-C6]|uniref:hypothetical protein n=1 Tax=Anaerotignum sp. MB30-C6 TaxID=3070814 RepID=UPI0027DE6CCB|nr:hypothetical protein [Anaerotignum sp. MB30-C6]WMI80939.1 hypothetical protein RBQ60_14130 [Anaerotignum sp. MB30-C6]